MPLWHSLAHAHVALGNTSRAVRILEAAVKAFPNRIALWGYLGMLYSDLQQWDVAEHCFVKVRETHPGAQAARFGLAIIPLLRDGASGLEKAAPILKEMHVRDGGPGLGQLLAELQARGQFELALLVALKAPPAERKGLALPIAESALAAGDLTEAAASYCSLLRESPMGGESLAQLADRFLRPPTLAWGLEFQAAAIAAGQGSTMATRALSLSRLGCPAWANLALSPLEGLAELAPILERLRAALTAPAKLS